MSSSSSVFGGMAALFAAYFVFEVVYAKKCVNFLNMIEIEILEMSPGKKLPSAVLPFMNKIQ